MWVRLHYVYPYPHVDDVIPLMAHGSAILPYLDMPFQHASPRILKLMKRPAAPGERARAARRWRATRPELTVRSTFIVGFPGETEAEFEELLAFLEAAQLDRVGCFAYSPVDGATANALPDRVPEEVKEERRAALHGDAGAHQRGQARANRRRSRVGHRGRTRSRGRGRQRHVVALARSTADAPEIDGRSWCAMTSGSYRSANSCR